jgi:threonine/homoserine/homoserine lactone efflux protein
MINTEFLLTSLIVVLVPGTGVIYTITTGLTQRWKASVAAALGCTAGIVPHLTASILGLSAILHMSAQVFQIIKLIGVLYLLYLARSMWRDKGSLKLDEAVTTVHGFQIVVKGILINILNPKLTIFFFAFLPLFVSPDASSPTSQMIGLSAIFMGMTFAVFVLYGILASMISKFLLNSPQMIRRMHRSFALVFAGLAVKLALSEQ